jgi:hypothetical protein
VADPVQICNMALGMCGARTAISSLAENSPAARACALYYDTALGRCLQSARWNFARAQVALSLLKSAVATPTPDVVPPPWIYEYAYPSDAVQVRYLMPLVDNAPSVVPGTVSQPSYIGPVVPFLISTDLDAGGNRIKVLLTNQEAASAVYTVRVTDSTMYDDQFTTMLANYLGYLISFPLNGDKALRQQCFEIAEKAGKEAEASNGNEGITIIDDVPDWIRVRGYAADWAFPPGTVWYASPLSLVA